MAYHIKFKAIFINTGDIMIQVLERTNNILNIISKNPNGVALKDIVDDTGLNKSTICNLLKTLNDIGYVRKKQSGIYCIGDKLIKLAYPYFSNDSFVGSAEKIAKELVAESHEAALVAVRKNGELQVIAKEIYDQSVVINTHRFGILNNYNTAVGHIYMAFDDGLNPEALYRQDLKNAYKSYREFEAVLRETRKQGYLSMTVHDGEIHAVAVPVFAGQKIIACLALVAPQVRTTPEKLEDYIHMVQKYGLKLSECVD